MRKVILFASKVIFLAEQCLRGHKAKWLEGSGQTAQDTNCLFISRDHIYAKV